MLYTMGFLGGSDGKVSACNAGESLPAMQETRVQSLGRDDSLEKGTATHSSTLARRIP